MSKVAYVSLSDSKSAIACGVAGAKIVDDAALELHQHQKAMIRPAGYDTYWLKVMAETEMMIVHFLVRVQFCGFW